MFLSRAAYGLFQGSVEEYANVTFPKLLGKKILLFFFFPPPFCLIYLFIYYYYSMFLNHCKMNPVLGGVRCRL